MRVIAGRAKGTRITAPKGRRTRPTADRVREALFSMLGQGVEGARVLDLFAGSGALGIEALSRGASQAVFVESNASATAVISDNLERTHLAGQARLVRSDVARALAVLAREGARFNLIFADPPYRMIRSEAGLIVQAILDSGLLEAAGTMVLEHSSRETPPAADGAAIADSRSYGDTALTVYHAIHGEGQ